MAFSTLLKKSLTPLLAVNLTVMIASAVLLIFNEYSFTVWRAALAFLVSPFLLPILVIPAAMAAGVMRLLEKAKPGFAKFLGLVSLGWLVALITFYVVLVFESVAKTLDHEPALTMAYGLGAAISPWALMAIKDRDNLFFTGLVWMAQLAALALMFLAVRLGWKFWDCVQFFGACMAIMLMLQSLYEKIFMKKPADTVPPASPSA